MKIENVFQISIENITRVLYPVFFTFQQDISVIVLRNFSLNMSGCLKLFSLIKFKSFFIIGIDILPEFLWENTLLATWSLYSHCR